MVGRTFVQNPGPTNIPDEVLEAFRRPATDFVAPAFLELVDDLWRRLPVLFGGAAGVVCYTSVGHGAWEGVFANLCRPGEVLLVPTSGRFALLWAETARNRGYDVVGTELDPDTIDLRAAPDPAMIAETLAADADHRIGAVLLTHAETSTGSLADLAAVRAAIDDAGHPALLVVDAIASFVTDPTSMVQFGLDVVMAASQKGLMMPPGLALIGLSQKAIDRAREVGSDQAYWSWPDRLQTDFVYQRFGGTPPGQHLYALRAALDLIDGEGGIDAVTARHRRLARATHLAVETWGKEGPWELNVLDPAQRSAAVTGVRAGDLDAQQLIEVARDTFHVSVGAGMLSMAGHGLRIGHLGAMNEPMLLGALAGLETAMARLGMPYASGIDAAARWLADPDT